MLIYPGARVFETDRQPREAVPPYFVVDAILRERRSGPPHRLEEEGAAEDEPEIDEVGDRKAMRLLEIGAARALAEDPHRSVEARQVGKSPLPFELPLGQAVHLAEHADARERPAILRIFEFAQRLRANEPGRIEAASEHALEARAFRLLGRQQQFVGERVELPGEDAVGRKAGVGERGIVGETQRLGRLGAIVMDRVDTPKHLEKQRVVGALEKAAEFPAIDERPEAGLCFRRRRLFVGAPTPHADLLASC